MGGGGVEGGGGGRGGGKPTPFARGGGGDDGGGLFARGGAPRCGGQEKPFSRAGEGDGGDQPKSAASGAGGDDGGDQPTPFAGVRFKLLGFKPDEERKYKLALESRGATESVFFGPNSDCTHVIVHTFSVTANHNWCVKGRQGNAMVINQMWLNHCIRKGHLVPTQKGIYKPSVKGGIPGSLSLSICCSGYRREEYEDIRMMVYLMGGNFVEKWSHLVSHVVCYRFEGDTYEQANRNGCKIVNKAWLQDSLNSWKILPSDNYYVPGEELEKRSQRLYSPSPVSNDKSSTSLEYRTPIEKSCTQSFDRLSKSTGNKRPRSYTSSKPKCVKSLQYSPDRSTPIDQYIKPEQRIISVQYPFERAPQKLTNPVLKRILLKAYVRACHVNNANRSLAGNFDCKNFIVTDPNEIVELVDVATVELTLDNRKADKKAFISMVKGMFPSELPPSDVAVWLKNIEEGWEDALLLNHINMGDTENTWSQFVTLYYCLIKLELNNTDKYKRFLASMAAYKNWYKDGFRWTKLHENRDYEDPRDKKLAKYEPN